MRTCPGHLSEPTAGTYSCSRGIGCLVGDILRTALTGDAQASLQVVEAHADRSLFDDGLAYKPEQLRRAKELLADYAVAADGIQGLLEDDPDEFIRRVERLNAVMAELDVVLARKPDPI